MILEFPGTRGEIEESSKKHRYHSSLVVKYNSTRVLVDYGEKHSRQLEENVNSFDGLLITHAHPDHYIWTLKEDRSVTIPVYLTRDAFDYSENKPAECRIIKNGERFSIKDLYFVPYKVIHSFRCPAVCFRIEGDKNIIYAPDLVDTEKDKEEVLDSIDCLIGDGSSLNINMVRRKDNKIYGHTRIKTEVNWCKKYGVKKLIITHCGKQVVTMDEKELEHKIDEYAERQVDVKVAYDGCSMEL
jgi:ribonuclease BN (tRNA processing enzyme)